MGEIDQDLTVEDSSEESTCLLDFYDLDFDDAYYADASDEEVEQEWHGDPYHLVDVPEPEEFHAIEEPQEISDMFAEIDQALDELDDVVAVGEGTEVYALYAEPISFSLLPLVDVDGEQRVRDEDVILDEQCDEVVGDGEQRVCDVAVIPDDQCAVVVGNGEERVSDVAVIPDGKNGIGQDGVIIEDKFEDQGRSIKRRRLMADKKPNVAADKKPKE